MAVLEYVIKKPLVTEKNTDMKDFSNQYGFVVDLKSNKNQVKEAIENLYDVKVLSVKTMIVPGKLKRSGRSFKKTSKTKKAYVQLKEGQKIEFFEGV